MSGKRPAYQKIQDRSWAAPVRPINGADLAFLQRAMAAIAPDWAVEVDGGCSGEAIVVLLPEDGNDTTGPSFIIGRETDGFRLDQVHWDVLTEIGVFASMSDVVAALGPRLTFRAEVSAPEPKTLH